MERGLMWPAIYETQERLTCGRSRQYRRDHQSQDLEPAFNGPFTVLTANAKAWCRPDSGPFAREYSYFARRMAVIDVCRFEAKQAGIDSGSRKARDFGLARLLVVSVQWPKKAQVEVEDLPLAHLGLSHSIRAIRHLQEASMIRINARPKPD